MDHWDSWEGCATMRFLGSTLTMESLPIIPRVHVAVDVMVCMTDFVDYEGWDMYYSYDPFFTS